jgi:chromosome partitioning protein
LLASQLAERGTPVTIIDADPERWISQWGKLPGKPDNILIRSDVTEETMLDAIDAAAAETSFVIVDLEGTANTLVGYAVSLSDLVIIPTQGSSMDAKGGAKTVGLVRRQERVARRKIPFAILLTRASAAVTSRAMRNVQQQLAQAEIDVFQTHIVERAAYRDIFDFGGTLQGLDSKQVSNLDKAIENAREFTGEVLARLRNADLPAQVA